MNRVLGIATAAFVVACVILLLATGLLYATGVFPVEHKDQAQSEEEAERFCLREGARRIEVGGRTFVCDPDGVPVEERRAK